MYTTPSVPRKVRDLFGYVKRSQIDNERIGHRGTLVVYLCGKSRRQKGPITVRTTSIKLVRDASNSGQSPYYSSFLFDKSPLMD